MVELQVLGPVELSHAGRRLDPGPPRQLCVLVTLALSPGVVVSADTLIEHVWSGRTPRDARSVLYTYVARLRRVLRSAAQDGDSMLSRTSGGYVLHIEPDDVDAVRFQALIKRARGTDDVDGRHRLLAEALGLWRATPLSGLSGEWAESVRHSLEQLRLSAIVGRIDLELRGDTGAALIDELFGVVAEHPLAERPIEQLMLALYRCGQAPEALELYDSVRHRLAEEVGGDPGPRLQTIHQQILRQDPALQPEPPEREQIVPRQLPAASTTFVGRQSEVALVIRTLTAATPRAAPTVTISGPGGVGKSALALHAAHTVSEHYPDGQLYIDLHGSSPDLAPLSALEAIGRFLRGLGVNDSAIPTQVEEAATKLRSLLAGKRVLLMLDNAASIVQVRALLPTTEGCAALITSRAALPLLDNTTDIALAILPDSDSARLLQALDQTSRIAADPVAAGQLAELCGHLPLALRVTAARMASRPSWPAAAFVTRLRDQHRRLDQFRYDDLSVRACFQVSFDGLERSHDQLDREAARAFRMLGLPDGPDISAPIAARLLDLSEPAAEAALERLVDAQLVESQVPGRYRMHDLVRLYARALARESTTDTERYAALDRTWQCYVATLAKANQLVSPDFRQHTVTPRPGRDLSLPDRAGAMEWLDAERLNLFSAVRQAVTAPGEGWNSAWQLTHLLFAALEATIHWADLHQLNEETLATARDRGDRAVEGSVLIDVGILSWRAGRGDDAVKYLHQSLSINEQLGNRPSAARSLQNLGVAHIERGEFDEASGYLEAAVAIRRELGHPSDLAISLGTLGRAHFRQQHLDIAQEYLRDALTIYEELGQPRGVANVLDGLAPCLLERGDEAGAIDCYSQALKINRELGRTISQVWNLTQLADLHRRRGDPRRARAMCEEALVLSRQAGAQQERALAHLRLGQALSDLGQSDSARAHWRTALPIFEQLATPQAAETKRLLESG